MFYSEVRRLVVLLLLFVEDGCGQYILGKRGQLAKVWLAAHMDNKLSKHQVFSADVVAHVRTIISQELIQPDQQLPLALRISGHLLLGVVRIFLRQVKYLLGDASETLTKMHKAFYATASGGGVDLPESQLVGKESAITLRTPRRAQEDDFSLQYFDGDDVEASLAANLAQPQEITLLLSTPQHDAALESLASLPEFDQHSIEAARGGDVEDQQPGGAFEMIPMEVDVEPQPAPEFELDHQDHDFFAAAGDGLGLGGALTPPRLSLLVQVEETRKRKVATLHVDVDTVLDGNKMARRVRQGENGAVLKLYRKPA
jgi:hypothetical protein